MDERSSNNQLERAAPQRRHPRRVGTAADGPWRATVDQRLAGLEDAIGDLRTRVNSVIGLIAAAVIGQVLLRLLGH